MLKYIGFVFGAHGKVISPTSLGITLSIYYSMNFLSIWVPLKWNIIGGCGTLILIGQELCPIPLLLDIKVSDKLQPFLGNNFW